MNGPLGKSRFFRPVMATYDDFSIILAGSKVYNKQEERYLEKIFKYQFGVGWTNLGKINPPQGRRTVKIIGDLEAKHQFGIYVLRQNGLSALNSLKCSLE